MARAARPGEAEVISLPVILQRALSGRIRGGEDHGVRHGGEPSIFPGRAVSAPWSSVAAAGDFPGIDGLRGIAAVSVLLCHTVGSSTLVATGWGDYLAQLRAGVQIFFVISRFVLYRPFVDAHLHGDRGPRLTGYFRRRLFRIFPAYWLVLIVGAYVLHVIFLGGTRVTAINFSLVQSYFHPDFFSGLGPAWTLVVEVSFYLALPFYAMALWYVGSRRRMTAEVLGVVCLFGIGLFCSAWNSFGHVPRFVSILPANLAPFALGMLLAAVSTWRKQRPDAPRWSRNLGAHPWAAWLLGVAAWSSLVWAVHFPAVWPLAPIPGHQTFEYALLLNVLGFCMVYPMVFGDQSVGLLRRGLQLRPVVYIGTISFAIYLWHVPVLTEFSKLRYHPRLGTATPATNFFLLTAVTLAVTVVVATASWFILEKPLIRLSRWTGGVPRWRRASSVTQWPPDVSGLTVPGSATPEEVGQQLVQ